MERHLVVVMSNPVEGREEEFHDWYENTHLDEVLATCGWTSAERFTLSAEQGVACGYTHLALYEAPAETAEQVIETLTVTRDQRQQSTSIDRRNAGVWIFSPAGQKRFHPDHT